MKKIRKPALEFAELKAFKEETDLDWKSIANGLGITDSMIMMVQSGKRNFGRKTAKAFQEFKLSLSGKYPEAPEHVISDGSQTKHVQARNWGGPYFGTSDEAPIISWAQAGGSHAYQDMGHDVPKIKTNCQDPNCYGLKVVGDSMEPLYVAGDIIIIAPNYVVQPNDLCLLKMVNEDAMFKIYLGDRNGIIRFKSFNPRYPTMELRPEDIEKIQPVWSVVRHLKDKIF
jgi:SOS-response transcriptional repressor LexA